MMLYLFGLLGSGAGGTLPEATPSHLVSGTRLFVRQQGKAPTLCQTPKDDACAHFP
jgi:hypothetical protein